MANWSKLTDGMQHVIARTFTDPELWTYEPSGGAAVPDLEGIFRAAHDFADPGAEIQVSTVAPVVHFRLSALGGKPSTADTFLRQKDSVRYRVSDVQVDGEGMVTVILKESPVGQTS